MTIYQGDDTRAFGRSFIEIEIENKSGFPVARAEFRVGCIVKTYNNPTNPIAVNFTEDETSTFGVVNTGYLAVYDQYGGKLTCPEYIQFDAKGRRV